MNLHLITDLIHDACRTMTNSLNWDWGYDLMLGAEVGDHYALPIHTEDLAATFAEVMGFDSIQDADAYRRRQLMELADDSMGL